MMRALLLCCVACGPTRTPRASTSAPADAVVGKHPYFVYGVRGADPELVPWPEGGTVVIVGDVTGDGRSDAVVLDLAANDRARIQLLADRPPRRLGRAVEAEHAGSRFGTSITNWLPPAVAVGDLDGDGTRDVVVEGRWETPESSPVAAPPLRERFLLVVRGGAGGLGAPLQQLPWAEMQADLLPSTDVDGDGRLDLVTYECLTTCTVGVWRAATSKLEAEKPIATWSKAERVVIAKSTSAGYVVVAVEPFAIRTYALERVALRELAQVSHGPREDATALMGPVAAGDFDADQKLDVAAVSRGNALFAWSGGKPVSLTNVLSDRIRQIAFIDLDRDGDDDLLVATDIDVAMYRGSPSGLESSPSWRAHLP